MGETFTQLTIDGHGIELTRQWFDLSSGEQGCRIVDARWVGPEDKPWDLPCMWMLFAGLHPDKMRVGQRFKFHNLSLRIVATRSHYKDTWPVMPDGRAARFAPIKMWAQERAWRIATLYKYLFEYVLRGRLPDPTRYLVEPPPWW